MHVYKPWKQKQNYLGGRETNGRVDRWLRRVENDAGHVVKVHHMFVCAICPEIYTIYKRGGRDNLCSVLQLTREGNHSKEKHWYFSTPSIQMLLLPRVSTQICLESTGLPSWALHRAGELTNKIIKFIWPNIFIIQFIFLQTNFV